MDYRFCRECMSATGLNPANSKLALDVKYTTKNRLVICDGPLHGSSIMVDPSGQHVDSTPVVYSEADLNVKAGHSLAASSLR